MQAPSKLVKAKAAKRQSALYCYIDASALTAVMFVLLFLFLAGTQRYHGGVSVDLAPAAGAVPMAGAVREDALLVTVMRDGQVFFRSSRTWPGELETIIRSGLYQGAEKRVFLQVDRNARYARVVAVLEKVQRAGVGNVSFITR